MHTTVEYQPDGEAPISSTDKRLRKDIANNKATADRYATPRRVRTDEVPNLVNDFVIAAKNAIEAGNCDRVRVKDVVAGLFHNLKNCNI